MVSFSYTVDKNNYLPGCLLYWRLLFLYISCSLFRSLCNSSKFFGLILKENYSYMFSYKFMWQGSKESNEQKFKKGWYDR